MIRLPKWAWRVLLPAWMLIFAWAIVPVNADLRGQIGYWWFVITTLVVSDYIVYGRSKP